MEIEADLSIIQLDKQIARAQARLDYLKSLKALATKNCPAKEPARFVWLRLQNGARVAHLAE